MNPISVVLFLVIIINGTRAKNLLDIFLDNRNIQFLKSPKQPLYIFAKTRTIGSFPRLPNTWSPKLIVDLSPSIETHSEAAQPEQNGKPLMRKLPIKDVNYKEHIKVNTEVTTRRSLMPTKKFTVRPHDVYAESGRQNYNWNGNRKSLYKLSKPEKQYNPKSYVASGSRKSKTTLVFPKRDYTKYFKENPKHWIFKRLQKNNFGSENEVPLKVVNYSNGEEKENITVPPNVFKSECKDQIDQIIEATEKIYRDELISPKQGNEISLVLPYVADDEEMTTDSDIEYVVSRPERSVNIIEEQSVATTFSGATITHQEYISHDLTFKNINT